MMMLKIVLCLLFVSIPGLSQTTAQLDRVKKDAVQFQGEINDLIAGAPGILVLQSAKATYLDMYGVVVTVEVALERPRNPFSASRSPEELRTVVSERRQQVQTRLSTFLKQRVPSLESIGAAQSVTVIVHLMNTNPADVPNLPSQLIFSVKKQDAASSQIQVREF